MKNFYLYILSIFTVFFIFLISYLNTYKESFNPEKQQFILLGDSVFKNDSYVSDGKSIDYLLIERTYGKTICLAKDDATIINVYNQIEKIPDNLNTNNIIIFLSIGGNDILSKIENGQTIDEKLINTMYLAYKKLVESIKMKYPDAKIVLFDIYYPNNLKYKQFHKYIQEWNKKIYDYTREKNYELFKISSILTKPEDFTFDIEPSSIGSRKVVNAILSIY